MPIAKKKAVNEEVKQGYSYEVHLIDGDVFVGKYDRSERGFLVFLDYAEKEHAFRSQNIIGSNLVCDCCGCDPCDCHGATDVVNKSKK